MDDTSANMESLSGGKRKNVNPDGSMEKKSKNVPDPDTNPMSHYGSLALGTAMGNSIMMPLVGPMDPSMMSQSSGVPNSAQQTYLAAQQAQMTVPETDHSGQYVVASLAGNNSSRQAGKQHRRTSLWNAFLSHKYKIRDTNEPYADFVKKVKIEWESMSDEQKQVYANLAAEITAARYMNAASAQRAQDPSKQRIKREPMMKELQKIKGLLEKIADIYPSFEYACFFVSAASNSCDTLASPSLQPFVGNQLVQNMVVNAAQAPDVWSDKRSFRMTTSVSADDRSGPQAQDPNGLGGQNPSGVMSPSQD